MEYQGPGALSGVPRAQSSLWSTRGTKVDLEYQGREKVASTVIYAYSVRGCLSVGARVRLESRVPGGVCRSVGGPGAVRPLGPGNVASKRAPRPYEVSGETKPRFPGGVLGLCGCRYWSPGRIPVCLPGLERPRERGLGSGPVDRMKLAGICSSCSRVVLWVGPAGSFGASLDSCVSSRVWRGSPGPRNHGPEADPSAG